LNSNLSTISKLGAFCLQGHHTRASAIRRLLTCDRFSILFLNVLWITALLAAEGLSQADSEETGPVLLSISPLMGQRGSTLQVEVRGNRLDAAYAVWVRNSGFKGRILGVEEVKDQVQQRANPLEKPKKPELLYRAQLQLQIDATTSVGVHALRLVSHRGVSNAIGFPVTDARVTVEAAGPHQTIEQAQPMVQPGFVSGKIGKPGEVDFYSFYAGKGDELRFEVVEGQKFDTSAAAGKFATELTLHRGAGSWFDPHRPRRVLFDEQRSSDLMPVNSGGTYSFSEGGQYFLQVSGLFGQGCPDCTYQVRVFPRAARAEWIAHTASVSSEWSERSFERPLTGNWPLELETRSVRGLEAPAKELPSSRAGSVRIVAEPEPTPLDPASHPLAAVEHEPNDGPSENISIPALIEGAIQSPGDLDSFKVKVEAGQQLAFELETPDAKAPYFNPRIGVVDSHDQEVFSNVERRLSMYNNNADPQVYLRAVRPKATHSFERAGEYVLQVRDITSRYGNPNYRYRLLVRPQIPHVGEISVISKEAADSTPEMAKRNEVNHLNLVRKEPRKLILVASYEEGFNRDLSFFFSGLPQGVQAFPAVYFSEERAPLEVTQNPDTVAPKQHKAAIVLLASADAPLTKQPKTVQLRCQPIGNGKLGTDFLVREFPLMVVERTAENSVAKAASAE